MPRPTRHAALRLLAATAGVLAVTVAADAQFPVPQGGNALDANQRLGSGGFNGGAVDNGYGAYDNPYVSGSSYGGGYGGYGAYGNNVVTGNVTGGRQFRGSIGYTDPRAFRDGTAGEEFDAFSRSASGVTTGGTLINYADAGSSRPFFGDNTVANPPGDFVRTPATGGFVPSVSAGASFEVNQPTDYRLGSNPAVRNLGGVDANSPNASPLARLFTGGALDADPNVAAVPQVAEDRFAARAIQPEALVAGSRLTGGVAERSLADVGGRTPLALHPARPRRPLGRPHRRPAPRPRRRAAPRRRRPAGRWRHRRPKLLTAPGGQAVDANANPNADAGEHSGIEAIERAVNLDDRVLRLADPAEQDARSTPSSNAALDRFKADPFNEQLRLRGGRQADDADAVEGGDLNDLPGLDFEGLVPEGPGAVEAPGQQRRNRRRRH